MNHADTETALIAVVMADSSAFWKVADLISADDFSDAGARKVWELLGDRIRAGGAADAITLCEAHPQHERTIFAFAGSFGTMALVRTYAERIVQRATERRVVAAGQRIAQLRGDDSLGEAQRILAACSPRNSDAVKHAKAFLREAVAGLQERFDAEDVLTGVPTSIEPLDEKTSGWQRSDLILLAARPSVGKTALALQCAIHAARQKRPVLFFSAEMAGRQLLDRAIAHVAGVSLTGIRQPKTLDGDDWSRINRAGGELAELPLWIDDSSGMTVDAVCARSRQVDAEQRLGLIVIDYLTHLTPPKAEKLADAVQLMTRQLKNLAKSLKVPVLLLSQLNRDGDGKPEMRHLRESGAIEQDADVILLMWRPEPERRELVELIVAKQRNGETGGIYLHADMARMRFTKTEERPNEQRRGSGFRPGGFGSARDRAAGS